MHKGNTDKREFVMGYLISDQYKAWEAEGGNETKGKIAEADKMVLTKQAGLGGKVWKNFSHKMENQTSQAFKGYHHVYLF